MGANAERRKARKGRRQADIGPINPFFGPVLLNLSGAPAKQLSTWVPVAYIVWTIGDSLVKIAHDWRGLTTLADIKLGVDANVSMSECGSPWFGEIGIAACAALAVIAGVALLFAVRERALRQAVIADLTAENAALERQIDPLRSTSGLKRDGETNTEG